MATATAPFFTESPEALLDDLLMRVCVELQLDATRCTLAESSYSAIGKLLEEHKIISRLRPAIYAQGSARIGTTVRPLTGEEFDLDLVCQFACPVTSFAKPVDALDLVERALADNNVYGPMLERKKRCIRLNYTRKFHLDILPACKDPRKPGTSIVIPDRELKIWTPSDPIGFGDWFLARSGEVLRRLLERAAPLPAREQAEEKPPLKLSVQLWKRWRDITYQSVAGMSPPSIVLTALSGEIYQGETSVGLAFSNIISQTAELFRNRGQRIVVLNPVNRDENLTDSWGSKRGAYGMFADAMHELDSHWKALLQTRGLDKLGRALERLFGEQIAKLALEQQARDIEKSRSRDQLGMKKASRIITGALGVSTSRVPRTTFYGKKT